MFNLSKSFSKPAFKKSTSIILPTILALGLSACSSDVARFALLDMQNKQTAQNNVQQSNLAPLNNAAAPTQNLAQNTVADSQFTAAIPSSNIVQTTNSGWMNNNPDTYRVSTGDTLYSISRRYGLTVEALRQANNFNQFTTLNIGQQIFLPRQSLASNSPRTIVNTQPAEINSLPQSSTLQRQFVKPVASNAFAPVQQASTGGGIYVVRAGDTLYSIARSQGIHVNTIKSLNGLSGAEGLRIGQQIRVNGTAAITRPAVASKAVVASKAAVVAPQKAVLAKPEKRSSSRFRWPVSGRVISEYGKKADGRRNDGLNVAVPPGTVVKAAENGVIAYSGNGLKSYGNLILIKHDGGWVTAYAHNGSILVKKGDKVRRGQAIARSGQTGDVNKPQLHFEIRRGALAVDPRKYLSSN